MPYNRYIRTENSINNKTVYGVEIETTGGDVYRYSCISVFSDEVDNLIRRMEQSDISPVHFNDIIADYIYSQYYKVLTVNGL